MNNFKPAACNIALAEKLRVLTFLCCSGLMVLFATLRSPFLYDDAHAIQDNPYIKDLAGFQDTVGIQNIFNRSVLLLTFSINHAVGRVDVFGYHLVNILFHLCVGIVLYFLTAELLSLEGPDLRRGLHQLPLAASLIHLFNPVTVQSVTYLSSRSSVLSTLFYLLSFYFVVRFARTREEAAPIRIIHLPLLALLFFLLGLGTKEIAVTLPLMAVFFLWIQSPGKSFRKFLPELSLVLVPLLAYLLYRYAEMGGLLVLRTDPASYLVDRGLYFLTQIKVLVSYYLLKLLFPIGLNFEPDIRLVSGWVDWQWPLSLALMGALAWAVHCQKSVLFKCAMFWAWLTVLPTSSIVPLKQIVTEHRTYLPGLGISLSLGILFLRALSFSDWIRPAFMAFLIVTGLLTLHRSLDYRSEVLLWEDTARKSPYKSLVHNNLGAAYLGEDRLHEAEHAFARSLTLEPTSSDGYINLGHIHARRKEWEKARSKFDLALKLGAHRSQVYFNAGLMRLRLNQPGEAVPFLQEAIRIKPYRSLYHFELGNAWRILQRYDDALKAYRRTLELEPAHAEAQNNIGVVFWKLKILDQAEIAFKKALAMDGDRTQVHDNLANLYLAEERFAAAIPHLEKVIALNPGDLRAQNLLHIARVLNQPVTP